MKIRKIMKMMKMMKIIKNDYCYFLSAKNAIGKAIKVINEDIK